MKFYKKIIAVALICAELMFSTSLGFADNYKVIGRNPDGSVNIPTDQIITPAGKQVEFAGRPNAVALSPDGKTAAFNIGGYSNGATPDYNPIITIDLTSGKIKQKFTLSTKERGGSYTGIIYSKSGDKLYASFGDGKILEFNVDKSGQLTLNKEIELPKNKDGKTSDPGGLALSSDNSKLYVALSRNNSIGVIDLTEKKMISEIPVGNAPYTILIDGNIGYVTNEGGKTAASGDYTNDSSGTPIISNSNTGMASTGTVSVVDLTLNKTIKNIDVGLHPTAICQNSSDIFVTNTNSDTISVINKATKLLVKTITVQPYPNAPFGSQPNAITMMGDKRLVVSLGSNNALAIYEWNGEKEAVKFEGLIPTGWFPGDVVNDPQLKSLVVANIKGVGSLGRENAIGPYKENNKTGHAVYSWLGSASIIPSPDKASLENYTKQVNTNNKWEKQGSNANSSEKKAIPIHLGEPSLIKHVFYVIKENRTYDQVLGDIKKGNGDPSLTLFGDKVTPNQHALANKYPLLDNFYCSGSVSADGHQWTDQALAPDYLERQFAGGFPRS
ncbi:hypothetical protein ACETAC_09655 [Aceticella autotrophica]|uniref:Uncharacterized protein n=1 Tax=Aceticella autotrophica TaxID=2755338 RepID=A0A975GA41_9THEO|nr:hypothetical protein [Aceticella autotrophica]QSZ27114.1 hypothetical protein ACETAC_09655 [Aceticella autotrophica]